MTKKELLEECWIPYSVRLPPNDDRTIVVWNYHYQRTETGLSRVFRGQQEQLRKNPNLLKEWESKKNNLSIDIAISGYKTSHWIELPSPNKEK